MLAFGLILLASLASGLLGSMVGLGGGILLIPVLTLIFQIPIHFAVGASAVAVVATSAVAAGRYLRMGLTNVPLAIALQTVAVAGAVLGGSLAVLAAAPVLEGILGGVMLLTAVLMARQQRPPASSQPAEPGPLGGSFIDPWRRQIVTYKVNRLPMGMVGSALAGIVSGLLGIGGGVMQVPLMVSLMGVPIRAAAATSNYMVGITAAASAFIYMKNGYLLPLIVVPAVWGACLGAILGSRLSGRVSSRWLRNLLVLVLIVLAIQMLLRTAQGDW